jgi:hypothetical protein
MGPIVRLARYTVHWFYIAVTVAIYSCWSGPFNTAFMETLESRWAAAKPAPMRGPMCPPRSVKAPALR